MSIFSHNIYENIRTRTIVLYQGNILLHPPQKHVDDPDSEAWKVPGGGLEPHSYLSGLCQNIRKGLSKVKDMAMACKFFTTHIQRNPLHRYELSILTSYLHNGFLWKKYLNCRSGPNSLKNSVAI